MANRQRRLFLIRHSAVTVDPEVASSAWQLSEDGRARCTQLADWLNGREPDLVVTSHEKKAVETGQILADGLGVPRMTGADLHEHDRRGVPLYASEAAFRTAVSRLLTQPDELVMGRETGEEAKRRFVTAVEKVLKDHPTGDLAIVTHGTVMTLFLCHFNPRLKPVPFWKSLTLPCLFEFVLPGMALVDEWRYVPGAGSQAPIE